MYEPVKRGAGGVSDAIGEERVTFELPSAEVSLTIGEWEALMDIYDL
jgi:hypothetical protein